MMINYYLTLQFRRCQQKLLLRFVVSQRVQLAVRYNLAKLTIKTFNLLYLLLCITQRKPKIDFVRNVTQITFSYASNKVIFHIDSVWFSASMPRLRLLRLLIFFFSLWYGSSACAEERRGEQSRVAVAFGEAKATHFVKKTPSIKRCNSKTYITIK